MDVVRQNVFRGMFEWGVSLHLGRFLYVGYVYAFYYRNGFLWGFEPKIPSHKCAHAYKNHIGHLIFSGQLLNVLIITTLKKSGVTTKNSEQLFRLPPRGTVYATLY